MLENLVNQSLGAFFAGAVLSTGFAFFCFNEIMKEVEAVKAAQYLYKVLTY